MNRFLIILGLFISCFGNINPIYSQAELNWLNIIETDADSLENPQNPFNPQMNFLPATKYLEVQKNRINYYLNDSVYTPYIKPEIFIKADPYNKSAIVRKFIPKAITLEVIPRNIETIGYWERVNSFSFLFNQISFSNWNAGGQNSIAGLIEVLLERNLIKDRFTWENKLLVKYGKSRQGDLDWKKTNDAFEFNSTFGYKTSKFSDWYYTSKFTFKSQITDGFKYPDIEVPISRFMSPGYMFLGIGGEYYVPKSEMKFYISPLTTKATFVRDQRLADLGSFGVSPAVLDRNGQVLIPGKTFVMQTGIMLSNQYEKKLFKNMDLKHNLILYTEYNNRFGNFDIEWNLSIDIKINKFFKANFGVNMIYDEDIKATEIINEESIIVGPKLQIKEQFGVGLVISL